MCSTISTEIIHKLDNAILEIRIRVLRDIEGKLKRGLQLKNSLTFCPPELFKYSLFWFRQSPICEVEAVLKLMISLLQSEYGDQIIGHYGVARIKKEITKIKNHLADDGHTETFNKLYLILAHQQTLATSSVESSLCSKLSNINLIANNDSDSSILKGSTAFRSEDLVECWEIPEIVDKNNLHTLHTSLVDDVTVVDNYGRALNYLQTAVVDWPAEFFLQPPYICKTLLCNLDATDSEMTVKQLQILQSLTVSLQGSKRTRQQATTYKWNNEPVDDLTQHKQISLNKYFNDTFLAAINYIKLREHIDQETLYENYKLMFELVNLLLLIKSPDMAAINDILVELGYLVKMFRQSWLSNAQHQHQSDFVRTQYLVVLYLISLICENVKLDIDKVQTSIGSKMFPHQPDYDPVAFESMSGGSKEPGQLWLNELYIAVLDFPLKDSHEQLYKIILACIEKELSGNQKMVTILHARDVLLPAINILREPHLVSDEELIYEGMRAIDTLHLHQSCAMVKRLFQAITNCLGYFSGNCELKTCGEGLYLRLLSTKVGKLKSLIYQLSADKFKDFFSCIVTGEHSLKKNFNTISSYLALGIPLTTEILTEIICFGTENSNSSVKNNAIIILKLLIKSKEYIGKFWKNVLQILIPTLPLLQCLAAEDDLGTMILDLFDPDKQNFSDFVLMQGNLRFLFARTMEIRETAISRLLFLLSTQPKSEEYLPNTRHIAGSIPDSLCVNKTPTDLSRTFGEQTYEEHAIHSLVQLLQTSTIEPSVRHTVLMQLDMMVKSKRMCEIFHDINGWGYCLVALDECLKENHSNFYPQNAMLAVGILSKICLQIPSFRQFLAEEIHFHCRLLRAVLIYHNNPTFKPDYTTLIFMLTFDEFVIGQDKQMSVPHIFSKLYIPFICDFHWVTSPYDHLSALEEILVCSGNHQSLEKSGAAYFDARENFDESQQEIFCKSFMCVSSQTKRENGKISTKYKSKHIDASSRSDQLSTDNQAIWQYIRLTFAYFWFNGFDHIIEVCKHSPHEDLKISYRNHLPGTGKNGESKPTEVMDFNDKLRLTSDDLSLIKCTFAKEKTKNYLDIIRNATDVQHVLEGVGGISVAMLIPAFQENLDIDLIDATVMKYIKATPNNQADEKVYICVLKFLGRQMDAGCDNILLSMLSKLSDKHVVFKKLLKSSECSKEVFEDNVNFITNIIEKVSKLPNLTAKKEEYINLLNDLFEETFKQMVDNFNRNNVDKVRVLTCLLKTLSMTNGINTDVGLTRKVVKTLLNNIVAMKSSSHVASNIYKNSLLCVNFLIKTCKELEMKSKYVKLLSILSGHQSFTIRALSWSILAELASSVAGAHTVIKELAYLPGGIHACCLSTILDPTEVTLVTVAATNLFIKLLQHRSNDGGSLHASVTPMCKEKNSSKSDPVALLLEIADHQQFFQQVLTSIEYFAVSDTFDEDQGLRITNCGTIACYVSIISTLFELNKSLFTHLIETRILILFIDCMGYVPLLPNAASLHMVSEICNLLLQCLTNDKELLVEMIASNVTVMVNLVYLLNLDHYDDFGDDLLVSTTTSIMKLLHGLAFTDVGLFFIENALTKIEFEEIIQFFNYGFGIDRQKEFQMTCMHLFVKLVKPKVESPATKNALTFSQLLETHQVKVPSESQSSEADGASETNEKIKKMSHEFLNRFADTTSGVNGEVKLKRKHYYGSELLFAQLTVLFDSICDKDKPENGFIASSGQKRACITTIQALLRSSPKVGQFARESKFIQIIIDRLENVNTGIGISCRDFIKKHGDSKKLPIIEEITLLTGIITNSAYTCPLTDTDADTKTIFNIIRLLSNLWSWATANSKIEIAFLKCLSIISKDCVTVCKCLTLQYQGVPHAILKLLITTMVLETAKAKSPKTNFDILKLGFDVLVNCCACIEGRILIVKLNTMDVIDRLHPAVTKLQGPWDTVTVLWLNFWERFSRHPEGAGVRHLGVLCALLRKSKLIIEILALKIMRNMAFVPCNKTALLASDDFFYVLKTCFDKDNYEQLFLVATIIWKLIANSQKAKHRIKNSTIPRKINECLKKLSKQADCEENDLYNVLKIIEQILDS